MKKAEQRRLRAPDASGEAQDGGGAECRSDRPRGGVPRSGRARPRHAGTGGRETQCGRPRPEAAPERRPAFADCAGVRACSPSLPGSGVAVRAVAGGPISVRAVAVRAVAIPIAVGPVAVSAIAVGPITVGSITVGGVVFLSFGQKFLVVVEVADAAQ